MRRFFFWPAAICLVLGGASAGHAATQDCAPVRLVAHISAAAVITEDCHGDITPWAYVGGKQLLSANLSDHALTATFYGHGAVVQVHQLDHDTRVRIVAVTVNPSATVHVRIVKQTITS